MNRATLEWDDGDPDLAAVDAQRATKSALRHLDQCAAIQTEYQQFLMARTVAYHLSYWMTISGSRPSDKHEEYADVLTWKGLITSRQQGLRSRLRNDPLFDEIRRIGQQFSQASLNPPQPPSNPLAIANWKKEEADLRKAWKDQRAALAAEYQRLEKELATKSTAFRESLEQRRVSPESLISALKAQAPTTGLVDFLEYSYFPRGNNNESSERRVAAFVVRGDQPIKRIELGSAEFISRQIAIWRGYRDSVDGSHSATKMAPGSGDAAIAAGHWLREQIWQPLLPALEGIELVFISPDGAIAQMPWGALPGEKPNSYLVEERATAIVPVPQMLAALYQNQQSPGLPDSLLLVGDIDYGSESGEFETRTSDLVASARDRKGMSFGQLAQGAAELAAIERRYQQSSPRGVLTTLKQRAATESAFCKLASKHQWLHVITHGFFAPESTQSVLKTMAEDARSVQRTGQVGPVSGQVPGLLSGLAFAGANLPPSSGNDDGILTALEVESLDLSGVDTVVLSACETGLGKVAGGEGVLGLQRAFQVAGAKTCVVSLWKVPDAATSVLMQRYYENLWGKNMGKLAALREAQIWMLKEGLKSSHATGIRGAAFEGEALSLDETVPPYFWAAFILSGDSR